MTTNKPESLPIWRAEDEWDDDEVVIRLSDYEALRAECELLRKDAERLDFIAQHPGWLRSHKGRWGCVSPFTNYSYPVFKTPRDAIDAAIQASHE